MTRNGRQACEVRSSRPRGQGEKGVLAVFAGLNEHRADDDESARIDIDAEFCAAARDALPALIDELTTARARLAKVEALASRFAAHEALRHGGTNAYDEGQRDAWDAAEADLRAALGADQ